jgi:hypothetical protein
MPMTISKFLISIGMNQSLMQLFRKMGQAVGFARDYKADLRSIQHATLSKAHIRKSAIAARAAKEEENATELLSKYTMINDTVSYQHSPQKTNDLRLK